jgi:hypothetical protein
MTISDVRRFQRMIFSAGRKALPLIVTGSRNGVARVQKAERESLQPLSAKARSGQRRDWGPGAIGKRKVPASSSGT